MADIGYSKPLFILPFDHRASFTKGLFSIEGRELTDEETQKIIEAKTIVFEALKKTIQEGVPKTNTALLVDEQYGDAILKEATKEGIITILTTEKSGQKEFDFEYGDQFGEHLEKYKPTFAKALVRYNPDDDPEMNAKQRDKLKKLSHYCQEHGFKLLIEPLVPATTAQLEFVGNDEHRYDTELRPDLTVKIIDEMQRGGIEVDVWKIEGMEFARDYLKVSEQAQKGGRVNVGIVILGRAAKKDQVEKWLNAGIGVPGVIGFAVGRTIFWEPLEKWRDGKASREEAIDEISNQYKAYCDLFLASLKK